MKSTKASTDSPQTLLQFPSSPFKPVESSPHEVHVFPASFFYEPTSVLDPNVTSSPGCVVGAGKDPAPLSWNAPAPLLPDDCDPVSSWLLFEKDDLVPPSKLVDDHPSLLSLPEPFDFSHELDFQVPMPPPALERAHLDLLVRAAHAVESSDYTSAHVILARLNPCLPSPAGSPLQRAAFYFKEALQSLLLRSSFPHEASLSAAELVRRIAAQKAFSDMSPIPQFISFTANQALLEALPGEAPVLHVIDFDLGLGGQWSSFAQELVARSRAARRAPPRLRLTAVLSDSEFCVAEAGLAADNLREFAAGIGLRLSVDLVRLASLGLGAIRLSITEPAGVVLSPGVLRGPPESSAAVLRFVRRASPRVVVFIDNECCCGSAASQPSFRRSFIAGLEHYAAVLESLDAAAAGAGEEPLQRVERAVIEPRVAAAVAAWSGSARLGSWADFFSEAGWGSAPLSEFAESQADWLLRRSPIEGFHVEKREGSMVLSWKGRDLAATSAWRC